MSYSTIHACANDQAFRDRVEACVAQEDIGRGFVDTMVWEVAAATDVEAAYASALAAGNPNPGGDEAVVTDGMILANVQANTPDTP